VDWRGLLDGPLPDMVRRGHMDQARAELDAFLGDPIVPPS
jgi:Sirohaem synthase dimerisation region